MSIRISLYIDLVIRSKLVNITLALTRVLVSILLEYIVNFIYYTINTYHFIDKQFVFLIEELLLYSVLYKLLYYKIKIKNFEFHQINLMLDQVCIQNSYKNKHYSDLNVITWLLFAPLRISNTNHVPLLLLIFPILFINMAIHTSLYNDQSYLCANEILKRI